MWRRVFASRDHSPEKPERPEGQNAWTRYIQPVSHDHVELDLHCTLGGRTVKSVGLHVTPNADPLADHLRSISYLCATTMDSIDTTGYSHAYSEAV